MDYYFFIAIGIIVGICVIVGWSRQRLQGTEPARSMAGSADESELVSTTGFAARKRDPESWGAPDVGEGIPEAGNDRGDVINEGASSFDSRTVARGTITNVDLAHHRLTVKAEERELLFEVEEDTIIDAVGGRNQPIELLPGTRAQVVYHIEAGAKVADSIMALPNVR